MADYIDADQLKDVNPVQLTMKRLLDDGWDDNQLKQSLSKVADLFEADRVNLKTERTRSKNDSIVAGLTIASKYASFLHNNADVALDSDHFLKKHLPDDNTPLRFAPLLPELKHQVNLEPYLYRDIKISQIEDIINAQQDNSGAIAVYAKFKDTKTKGTVSSDYVIVWIFNFVPGKSAGYKPSSTKEGEGKNPIEGFLPNQLCYIKPKNLDSNLPYLCFGNLFSVGNLINERYLVKETRINFAGLAICIIASYWTHITKDNRGRTIKLQKMGNIADHYGRDFKKDFPRLKSILPHSDGGYVCFVPVPNQSFTSMNAIINSGSAKKSSSSSKKKTSYKNKSHKKRSYVEVEEGESEFAVNLSNIANQLQMLEQQNQQELQRLQQQNQNSQQLFRAEQNKTQQLQQMLDQLKNAPVQTIDEIQSLTRQFNQIEQLIPSTPPLNQNAIFEPSQSSQYFYDLDTQPFSQEDIITVDFSDNSLINQAPNVQTAVLVDHPSHNHRSNPY